MHGTESSEKRDQKKSDSYVKRTSKRQQVSNKQNDNSARASLFLYIFFAVITRLRRGLEPDSTPGELAYISKRVGTIAMKIEKRKLTF